MKKFSKYAPTYGLLALTLLTLLIGYVGCSAKVEGDTTTTTDSDIVTAANAFLDSLTAAQKTTVNLEMTVANAETWSNLPIPMATRNGIAFADLNTAQSEAALAMIKAATSTTGYTIFSAIRTADDKLATINSTNWGSGKYYIAILGTPSTTTPWILQVGGHHMGFNFTYHGTAASGTPMFVGLDPPTWTDADGAHTPLETQRAAVEALATSVFGTANVLLPGMFDDVVMGPNGTGNHDTNFPQSYPTSNRGVAGSALSAAQKTLVKTAIAAWVNTLPTATATSILADYETDEAINNTYVALGGNASHVVDFSASPTDSSGKGSYLRIDGPRVWIEFVVQIGAFNTNGVHYHTLWRDKEKDYGAEFE